MSSPKPPLSADDFIDVVYRDVYRSAVKDSIDLIESPPGRTPAATLIEMHDWFVALSDENKKMVRKVLAFVSDTSVFGMLCLLDNARPVSQGYQETLSLKVVGPAGERPLVTDWTELHDLFRDRVDAEGSAVGP